MSFYLARSLCTCVFILHSSPFLLRKGRNYCKSTNIFWISYQILAFSAYDSPKMTFSKFRSYKPTAYVDLKLNKRHSLHWLMALTSIISTFAKVEHLIIYNRRQYHRGGCKFGIRGRGIYFYNIHFTAKVTTYNLFISNPF